MLETKIDQLTQVIAQLIAVMSATAQAPTPAPQPQYQAPPQAAPPPYQAPVQPAYQPQPAPGMPAAPFQPPQQTYQPQAAPPPQQYPFHDNVTASMWAKDVWGKAAAINQEQAMAKFGALMQNLGAVDFDSLTPDKFPMLYAGVQQLKQEMGIPG